MIDEDREVPFYTGFYISVGDFNALLGTGYAATSDVLIEII